MEIKSLYVIEVSQAGGQSGIIAKGGNTLFFSSDEKAREYAREFVEGKVFMLIGWTVISRKKAKEQGYQISETTKIIDP